jgi:ABC-type transport system substrate-binding protein
LLDGLPLYGQHLPLKRVLEVPENAVYYTPMNLAFPPFDDVHVRRAVVLAIDRAQITRRFTEGEEDEVYRPISHLLVPSVEGGLIPEGWRPAWASGVPDDGDVDAARAEMALSRYDHDGDGVCDDAACRGIVTLVETEGVEYDYSWWWRQVRGDVAGIGLELEPRVLPCWNPEDKLDVLDALNRPDTRYGLALGMCYAWAPDFPNGSTFIPVLDSSGLDTNYNGNYALLGATSEQLRSWGYQVTEVPSVDDRIDACMALTGSEHTQCWAGLDQYLSQEVVPWVPMFTNWRRFVLGERIDHVSVSVQNARPALDRISLVPGSE